MPRYFFHVRGGRDPAEDLTGTELPDAAAARAHAERFARERRGRETVNGDPPTDERLEVEDEEHRTVFTLPWLAAADPEI